MKLAELDYSARPITWQTGHFRNPHCEDMESRGLLSAPICICLLTDITMNTYTRLLKSIFPSLTQSAVFPVPQRIARMA
jgi:hypothetical protein